MESVDVRQRDMMDNSNLKRPIETMPEFVLTALEKENPLGDYESRPAYQRNDYLLWINSAKRQDTKEKRLRQMLAACRTESMSIF